MIFILMRRGIAKTEAKHYIWRKASKKSKGQRQHPSQQLAISRNDDIERIFAFFAYCRGYCQPKHGAGIYSGMTH
jgi:hypothetical protein